VTNSFRRVWDTATGQCLRTLVHEDNAPVTTVSFSPSGKYILAFTLDSCVRLWDYVAGTCKKTYQGHVNTKYSIGGAFGIGGEEGFIVSGSEDGEILFWDFRSKEVAQRIKAHEGVVCWVDTSPGPGGIVASGGMDGIVRIWADEDDDGGVGGMNGLKLEHEDGAVNDGNDVDMAKVEDGDGYVGTHIPGSVEEQSLEQDVEGPPNGHMSPDRMDED
jgi:COMPASS component SWD3